MGERSETLTNESQFRFGIYNIFVCVYVYGKVLHPPKAKRLFYIILTCVVFFNFVYGVVEFQSQ